GVVDGAVAAVQQMRASPNFAGSGVLQRAKAVVIVPRSLKVAALVGGAGGHAVLLARTAHGWSGPAFYTVASGSLGPQIGVRESTIVLLLMTDRALDAFLHNNNVTLGASANLTVAQYSASGAAAIGSQDVVVWTDSQGLFVGGSVAAQGFSQDGTLDQAYYGFSGQNMTATEILAGASHNPGADRLKAVL
ncbi:MAG: lipid-binding SYLF domain-containing protein, partial [Acetobacteraceae bacterium]|nr:lipid-binding SYLF domain-containing protein [Acetobacteraceae bacterium]